MLRVAQRLMALSLIFCLLLDASSVNAFGGGHSARAAGQPSARALLDQQALIPPGVGAQYSPRSYLHVGIRLAVIGVVTSAGIWYAHPAEAPRLLKQLWSFMSLGGILAMVHVPSTPLSSPQIATQALHQSFHERPFTFDEYVLLRKDLSVDLVRRELDQLVALGIVTLVGTDDQPAYALIPEIASLWPPQIFALFHRRPELTVETVPNDLIPDLRAKIRLSAEAGALKAQDAEEYRLLLVDALKLRTQKVLGQDIGIDQGEISRIVSRIQMPNPSKIPIITGRLFRLGPPEKSAASVRGRSRMEDSLLKHLRDVLLDANRRGLSYQKIADWTPYHPRSIAAIALGEDRASEKSRSVLLKAVELARVHRIKLELLKKLKSWLKIRQAESAREARRLAREERLKAKEEKARAEKEQARAEKALKARARRSSSESKTKVKSVDWINSLLSDKQQRLNRREDELQRMSEAENYAEDDYDPAREQTVYTALDHLFAGARVTSIAPMAYDYDMRAPAIPDRGAQAGRDRLAPRSNLKMPYRPPTRIQTPEVKPMPRVKSVPRIRPAPAVKRDRFAEIEIPELLTEPSLDSWRMHLRHGIGKLLDHGFARVKFLTKPGGYWQFQIHMSHGNTIVDDGIAMYAWPPNEDRKGYIVVLYRNRLKPGYLDSSFMIDVPPSALRRVHWDADHKRISLVWDDSAWPTILEQTWGFRDESLPRISLFEWYIPDAHLSVSWVSESDFVIHTSKPPLFERMTYSPPMKKYRWKGFAKLDLVFALTGLTIVLVAAPWLPWAHILAGLGVIGMAVFDRSSSNHGTTLSVPVITHEPDHEDAERAMARFKSITKTEFPSFLQSEIRAIQDQVSAMSTKDLAIEALKFTSLTARDVYDILAQWGVLLSEFGVQMYRQRYEGDIRRWIETYHDVFWKWEVIAELSRREPRINEKPRVWLSALAAATSQKGLRIENVQASDPAVSAYLQRALKREPEGSQEYRQIQSISSELQHYASHMKAVFAAKVRGRIVGLRILFEMPTEPRSATHLYGRDAVSTAYQGKGIGRLLRATSFVWMMDHGYEQFVATLENKSPQNRMSMDRAAALLGLSFQELLNGSYVIHFPTRRAQDHRPGVHALLAAA